VCLEERRAQSYCVSEQTGLCFDNCVRESQECGSGLLRCEWNCSQPIAKCEAEQLELERCKSELPVWCGQVADPAPSAEDIPCCEAILTLLECAGFEGEGECGATSD
jgi:hypothetical protein